MALTDQQRAFYENILTVARQEMEDHDSAIEVVLAKVKRSPCRTAERQEGRAAVVRGGLHALGGPERPPTRKARPAPTS